MAGPGLVSQNASKCLLKVVPQIPDEARDRKCLVNLCWLKSCLLSK